MGLSKNAAARGLRKLKRYVRDNFETTADAAEYFGISRDSLRYYLSAYGQRNARMNYKMMAVLHEKTGIEELRPPKNDSKKPHERLAHWIWENFDNVAGATIRLNIPLNTLYKYISGTRNIGLIKLQHRISIYEATGIEEFRPKGYQRTATPERFPGTINVVSDETSRPLMMLSRSRAGSGYTYHAKVLDHALKAVEFDVSAAGYPYAVMEIFKSLGGADVVYNSGFDKKDAEFFDAFLSSGEASKAGDQQAVIDKWFADNRISFSERIAAGMDIAADNPEYGIYLKGLMLARPSETPAFAGV